MNMHTISKLHFDLSQNLEAVIQDLDCKSMITIYQYDVTYVLAVFRLTKCLKSPLG